MFYARVNVGLYKDEGPNQTFIVPPAISAKDALIMKISGNN